MARIGIFNPVDVLGVGGVFQYITTMINALKKTPNNKYIIFYEDKNFEEFCDNQDNCNLVHIPSRNKLLKKVTRNISLIAGISFISTKYNIIKNQRLDLLICPSLPPAFHFGIPYVSVIYDLSHKHYPEFPEYNTIERIRRDTIYRNILMYSTLIVTMSGKVKQDLTYFYKAKEEKIRVIPCPPASYIYKHKDIAEPLIRKAINKYDIPDNFIFYPAQIWHHKNHIRLIKALDLIRVKHKIEIPLVLVGSKKEQSTFNKLEALIKELKINNQIFYLGYVPEEDIVALYKKATALVFPSLMMNVGIPIYEAMALGVPVICSDTTAIAEQVANAGIKFNPFNVENIADKIYKVWIDENLRKDFIQMGLERVENLTLENYAKEWNKVINEALEIANKF